MAGSCYPLNKEDKLSKELLIILKQIKDLNENIAYSAMCGEDGQYDNSFSDGAGVTEVRIGMDLLACNFGIKEELSDYKPGSVALRVNRY